MAATAGVAERKDGTGKKEENRPAGGSLERVTVNLTTRSARSLELATELTGDSKTDAINRAIQVYSYLEYILSKGGSVHVRETEGGEPERLKFF